jgi:hypothetical protein
MAHLSFRRLSLQKVGLHSSTFLREGRFCKSAHESGRYRLAVNDVGPLYIESGAPWQNGVGESFNGKLRDECLNLELFTSLREARVVIEDYRREYNHRRPHSSLAYRTPAAFAAARSKTYIAQIPTKLPESTIR